MTYVLVTAHRAWGEVGDLRGTNLLDGWAERLDDLDGEPTNRPGDPRRGGPVRQIRIAPLGLPTAELHSSAEVWSRFEMVMLSAFRAANLHAWRGTVALVYGHGLANRHHAFVDLAPVGALRVDRRFFEAYAQVRGGGASSRGLSRREQLFEAMGEVLREGGRVRQVDLYSCSVGLGPHGRAVLDWIHHLWRIPVRGLRGELVVDGHDFSPAVVPRLEVRHPPGSRGARVARFVDRLITDPSLWTRSSPHRPAAGESTVP